MNNVEDNTLWQAGIPQELLVYVVWSVLKTSEETGRGENKKTLVVLSFS